MTSSYSTDLKLELMVTGENAGTWGDNTNNNLNLIQQAISGFEQVTLSSGGTLALAMTDKTISNARNMVIKFATASIAASTICTIPDSIEKFYIFDATGLTNPTNLTIKTASGTGFTLDAAKIYAAYSDGTNLNEISLDTLGGTVAAANITGTIATSQIADDAVTYAKIQDTTTANRVIGAASAGAVGEVQVATDMIEDDAVTADKLANTAVSAGSFTSASITVDAQGRLTAASSGGGAANMNYVAGKTEGQSGQHTTNANASKVMVYAAGGGGGATGGARFSPPAPPNGGAGGIGFFTSPVQGSTAYAFSVGSGGAGGNGGNTNGNNGSSGGATNLSVPTTITANGGGGGGANNPGSDGSLSTGGVSLVPGFIFGPPSQNQVSVGAPGPNNGNSGGPPTGPAGAAGGPGRLIIYENIG